MAAPLAVTYVPPAPPLPAWLSVTSSPTATTFIPYTFATLLPDGVPTLLASAVQVTRYATATLQLPITVDSAANVEGIDLGSLYTTAGGTDPTVVRELGGTRAFTLGTATRALAAETSSAGEGTSAGEPTTATGDPASSSGLNGTGTPVQQATRDSSSPSPSPSNASPTPSTVSTAAPVTSGNSATVPSATSSLADQSSLRDAQSSISAALATATQASTADPSSVASLRSALASASSALDIASSASIALPLTSSATPSPSLSSSASSLSSSGPSSSFPSSPSSLFISPSPATTNSASDASAPTPASAPERLNSLTPSQLAAAIATPICFFFLLVFLLFLCCCCVRRRRRKRAEAAASGTDDGAEGQGGGAGGGGAPEMQEEQGLLGFYAGAAHRPSLRLGSSGRRRNHQRKITWEWVPARTASPKQVSPRPDGAGEGGAVGRSVSRASGRSALAALTGGFFGAGAAAPAATRGEGNMEGVKGKGDAEGHGHRNFGSPLNGVGLLAVRSASRASYSPIVGDDNEDGGGELQDVDLTSPRVNEHDHGHFAPLPLSEDDEVGERERVRSLQPLPSIVETNGALRLSRYYTPDDSMPLSPPGLQAYEPFSPTDTYSSPTFATSSPSSVDSPPPRTPPLLAGMYASPIPLRSEDTARYGPVQEANRSLDQLRNQYVYAVETDLGGVGGAGVEEGKRETRLGLSWSTAGRGSLGTKQQQQQQQQQKELTPPTTPSDRYVPPRADTPSADHPQPLLSEMGWLSGRWSGILGRGQSGRGSDEEEGVGIPDEAEEGESGGSGRSRTTVVSANSGLGLGSFSSNEIFINRPRWLGASQSSTPPFVRPNSADSITGALIAYDPPVQIIRSSTEPSSLNNGTDIASVSRYDDTPALPSVDWVRTPSLQAFPDSPLMHSPFARGSGSTDRTPSSHDGKNNFIAAHGKRQSSGGVSVLNRIAASFSVHSGFSNAGLGIDEDGESEERDEVGEVAARPWRGGFSRQPRSREVSTESATDPYHHTLPNRPRTSPVSPPRRPPRDIRRSQLRSSQTTPILFLPETDAPPLPFVTPLRLSISGDVGSAGSRGRSSDPFEGEEDEEGKVVWAGEGERRPSKTVPEVGSLQTVTG
ncbi:hypothetical protein JCM11251_004585 [Rhodosporidiobolus azoricus]